MHARLLVPRSTLVGLAAAAFLVSCGDKKVSPSAAEPAPAQGRAKGFRSAPAQAGAVDLYAPITEPGRPISLGYGVDVNNHAGISNRCIEGKVETIPQQEGYINLDASYSTDELTESLGASAEGSVKFVRFGFSPRAQYSRKLKERVAGLNYALFAYNKHHAKVFVPTGRTELYKNASPEEWNADCGTGYVAAQDYGSMLIINFSVHHEDRQEDVAWGVSAKGSFMSFAKLRASIEGSRSRKSRSGSLSISAFQLGGKPEELGKILKSGDKQGVIENFALCNLDKPDECLAGLRSIEDYVANVFPKQIADKEQGGGAILNHYPFRYAKGLGSDVNPALQSFVSEARVGFTKIHDQELSELETLKSLGRKNDSEITETMSKMEANLSAIRSASELCFKTSTYGECRDRYDTLRVACAETTVPDFVTEGGKNAGGNTPVPGGE